MNFYFHRCDFYRAANFYSVLSKFNKKKILWNLLFSRVEVRNKNKLNGLFIMFVPLFLLVIIFVISFTLKKAA